LVVTTPARLTRSFTRDGYSSAHSALFFERTPPRTQGQSAESRRIQSPTPDAGHQSDFNSLQQQLRKGHVIHPVYLLHTSLDTFSSPDLVHWTRHPQVLDIRNVSWAAYAIWAPSAIHLNGH
jgi:hypothetical protein